MSEILAAATGRRMGHGFSGTQDQLEPYARRFTEAGIALLTFDYRNFGRSEGEPRQLVNVDRQGHRGGDVLHDQGRRSLQIATPSLYALDRSRRE
jgi:fermentation-respiration switch protein FrsA (DUF1100 family)